MTCDCIERIQEQLRPFNTQLSIGHWSGGHETRPMLLVESIRKGGMPIHCGPTHCPFCGRKYDADPQGEKPVGAA